MAEQLRVERMKLVPADLERLERAERSEQLAWQVVELVIAETECGERRCGAGNGTHLVWQYRGEAFAGKIKLCCWHCHCALAHLVLLAVRPFNQKKNEKHTRPFFQLLVAVRAGE